MMSERTAHSDQLPSFDIDVMLGGLAKWLRILGFDAAFPRSKRTRGRTFVTKRQQTADKATVLVTAQRPLDQLRQTLDRVSVTPDPLLFMSRCLICNVPVSRIDRSAAMEQIPERVLTFTKELHTCRQCGRIYWNGGHVERMRKELKRIRIDVGDAGDTMSQ